MVRLLIFCVLFFFFQRLSAQGDGTVGYTVGVEFKALLNPTVFNLDSVVLIDSGENFRAVYNYAGGFGFGGIVRVKLTEFWNVETGINYTRRRYDFTITDLDSVYEGSTEIRVVGYEIPLKALVYIQMGKKIFMDVALGVSADFFASDVISLDRSFNFRAYKRGSFIKAAVLANVGVEYRTEKDGYFYIGAGFHQILSDIMVTEVNFYRDNQPGGVQQFIGRQRGLLDGSYFSVDLRYFFPVQKPTRPKVNRVIPDWKKM